MGKSIFRIISSFFFLFLAFFAESQTIIIPNFRNFSVDQGLSQSSVYSIYQDKAGYMWFGTADGVNRFDGEFIKVYKTSSDKGIASSSNAIKSAVVEDSRSNIWFSTETGLYMIDRLNDKVFRKFSYEKEENLTSQFKIQFIHNDSIWMFHPVKGICCYCITTSSFKSFRLPFALSDILNSTIDPKSSFPLIWISQYPQNNVWEFNVTTLSYKTIIQNGGEWLRYTKAGNSSFLFTFSQVTVYNSNNKPVARIDLDNQHIKNTVVRDIIADNYNRVWIATLNKGLMMYDYATGEIKSYQHDNGKQHTISINLINCLYTDRDNNLWIGTDGGGVCRLDLKLSLFNKFPFNEGDYPALKDYFIKCFYEDEKGNIWFGTHNNGFCIFNPRNEEVECIDNINGKKLMIVGDILKDKNSNIWIGHSNGVARYDVAAKKFHELPLETYFPLHNGNIFIYRLLQRRNGDIVAATSQTLLNISSTGKNNYCTNARLTGSKEIPVVITDIKELPDSKLIFTAPGNGVYIIDSNLNNISVKKRFLNEIDLRCVVLNEHNSNHVWIGSGAGLIDLNYATGEYKLYNKSNGFANEYIYSVLPDSNNNLWMSTNGGIIVFNPKTGFVKNFTVNDDLQSNEFNTGAYYKSASGKFYFGGIKGFNWTNPSLLNAEKSYPRVSISQILVNNQPYLKDSGWNSNKKINLRYNENDFFFQVSVLDYTKPEANKIWYQLKGWDDEPIITNIKDIRYNNLPPGKYEFVIKAANWSGAWSNENMQVIIIYIKSPFWKTWWFYTLIGILVVSVIIAVTRYVTQNKLKEKLMELEKQKELDKERQRISREMHDDIGAGLTQITLMSESVKGKVAAKELDDIAGTSRTLISNMSEIIWSLNQENKTLDRLWAYLREQLNKQLEYSGIDYAIDLSDGGEDIVLNNEQRRNILLVVKEIVNNAIKYSNASGISIKGVLQEKKLLFRITDNGTGFDVEKNYTGNGLKNIRKRIEDVGGTLNVASSAEKGVAYMFTVPLEATT